MNVTQATYDGKDYQQSYITTSNVVEVHMEDARDVYLHSGTVGSRLPW